MKNIKLFEQFVNESQNFDIAKAKAGDVTPWGDLVTNWGYGLLRSGELELSSLSYFKATNIANALKAAGFDAEALQVRGVYYDGYVHISNLPKAQPDIMGMTEIIEGILNHILVNDRGQRVSKTGKL